MKRTEKEEIIEAVKAKIVRAKGMYFTDFTGITVEEITELRREFRKANVDFEVVKNTLARKALESATGYDSIAGKLTLPTAIAFGYDDPIAPAKIIKKYREKNDKLKLKVCVVEKQVFDGAQLDTVAKFATRGETIAAILGSIQAPITGVAGAIHAVIRDLVNVVDAIEKKKAA